MTSNNLSPYQQEILKQEIDIIDKTIARIDLIQQSMKNWTIAIWGGSLTLIVHYIDRSYPMILLTGIIPLLFGYIDVVWKRQILKVGYRQRKISDFISGFNNDNEFRILDPIGSGYISSKDKLDFERQTSFKKAIWYKADGLFYLSLFSISIILGISLYLKK